MPNKDDIVGFHFGPLSSYPDITDKDTNTIYFCLDSDSKTGEIHVGDYDCSMPNMSKVPSKSISQSKLDFNIKPLQYLESPSDETLNTINLDRYNKESKIYCMSGQYTLNGTLPADYKQNSQSSIALDVTIIQDDNTTVRYHQVLTQYIWNTSTNMQLNRWERFNYATGWGDWIKTSDHIHNVVVNGSDIDNYTDSNSIYTFYVNAGSDLVSCGLSIGTYCILFCVSSSVQIIIAPVANKQLVRRYNDGWTNWTDRTPMKSEILNSSIFYASDLNDYTDPNKVYYFDASKDAGFGSEAHCQMICYNNIQYITNLVDGSRFYRLRSEGSWGNINLIKVPSDQIYDGAVNMSKLSNNIVKILQDATIETGTFSNVNAHDSNATISGSYMLLNDICIVFATATIINSWADIDYNLPVAPIVNTTALSTDSTNCYRVSTSADNGRVYIHRVENSEYQTDGTVSFTLVYKYK